MAPLTRMRAQQPGNAPGELNALYYGQRASAGGLLISEATQVRREAKAILQLQEFIRWNRLRDGVWSLKQFTGKAA